MSDTFDPEVFARQGKFVGSGTGRRLRSQLAGIVPDGVASVEAVYPRFSDRGPQRRAVDHGRRVRLRAAVVDNVVAVAVPRPIDDVFPAVMLWRDAAGAVVRVLR